MTRLFLALMLGGQVLDTPAPDPALVRIDIHMYQQSEYRPALVADLQRALTRLLAGSGLGLTLIDCHSQNQCQDGSSAGPLVLRLMPGRDPSSPDACGRAHPGPGGTDGVLMTIYAGCIAETTGKMRSMAVWRRAAYEMVKLKDLDVLAPIIVHETLHLLLPDESHGTGLWKATFDQADLERALRGRLRLGSGVAARARAAAHARCAAQAGSGG